MKELLAANLKYLRKLKGKSQSDIGFQLNKAHTSIGNWEKGLAEPSLSEIKEIARIFEISAEDLLFTDLAKGKLIPNEEIIKNQENGKVIGKPIGKPITFNRHLNDDKKEFKPTDIGANYGAKTPKVITLDAAGEENIVYVPIQARAGYLNGFGDAAYVEKLPSFNLPGLSNGTYRMFEVDGVSMAPTILNGDRIICRWVNSLEEITDNRVYVVVTRNGIVIKRLLNRISQRGKIVLKSDTIAHRKEYPTYEINPEDVLELWYSVFKFSADLSEPADMYHRVADLEADMVEMRSFMEEIKVTKAMMPKSK